MSGTPHRDGDDPSLEANAAIRAGAGERLIFEVCWRDGRSQVYALPDAYCQIPTISMRRNISWRTSLRSALLLRKQVHALDLSTAPLIEEIRQGYRERDGSGLFTIAGTAALRRLKTLIAYEPWRQGAAGMERASSDAHRTGAQYE